jgi:hypothetical protein
MIKEMIGNLRAVNENIWGLYTFMRDPLNNKVTDKEKTEMIEKANACGREEAIALKEKYGMKSCRDYVKNLGLDISEIEERNSDDYILFAKFNSPNKISICINNVKKAEETVKKENLNMLIDEVKIEDVLMAHEMFHFIEGKNKKIYTRKTKIRLWQLGPLKNDSGLVALGEIAAMAFAKELLQLSYYPNLFDILLLHPHDEKRAKALYDEVYEMKGNDNHV